MVTAQCRKAQENEELQIDSELSALIPPLTEDERRQLEANLRVDGCRDPLVVWQEQGILLDGHNRYRLCQQHHIEFDVRQVSLPDRNAAKVWIIRNQFGRRNLTPYQRAELALKLEPLIAAKAKEKQRAAGGAVVQKSGEPAVRTDKELARTAGVSHDTIAKAKFLRDNADDQTKEQLRTGQTSIHAAYKAVRKKRRHEDKAKAKAGVPSDLPAATDRYTIHQGELAKVGGKVSDNSVDWLITDPPYGREHLHLYGELSEFASRVLKPGGSLICMTGQSYLPEVMEQLAKRLNYHWALAYHTPGGQSVQLWDRKVNTFWKPLLWFVKGRYGGDWVGDVCRSEANDNDKQHHPWGQSESGMADIIERFTYPGQTVCDPFCGGGTTGVVAVRMNRLFIGIDCDGDAVATTLRRLAEVARA